MLSELKQGARVAGVKQTRRAIEDGRAARVFLAEDADPRVTGPVEELCREKDIPVERVSQMKELGSACGIAVGSAVAALLHELLGAVGAVAGLDDFGPGAGGEPERQEGRDKQAFHQVQDSICRFVV